MKNMKVRVKLLLAFIIVAVMVAVAGTAGIIGLNTMSANELSMYENAVTTNNASLSRRNMQAQRAACRGAGMKQMLGMEYESEIQSLYDLDEEFNELIAAMDAAIKRPENRGRLEEAKKAYAEYETLREPFVAAVKSGDKDELIEVTMKITAPIEAVAKNLDEISQSAIQVVNDKAVSDGKTADMLVILLVALVIISIAVAMFFAFYISGMISAPLVLLTEFMNKAGTTGDITLRAEDVDNIGKYSKNKDEIGQCIGSTASFIKRMSELGGTLETVAAGDLTSELSLLSGEDVMGLSLNKMTDNLNTMFDELKTASVQVSAGAGQVSQAAQGLASGSSQQAASIQEFTASLTELQEKTGNNAANSVKAREVNDKAGERLGASIRSMGEMLEAMKAIDESSGNITKVIKVIDDIAFQTNILALNAAVEAARAGQHGKGFAVVADEVRNLASKSAAAAKETADLIDGSSERVKEGNQIVAKTNADLKAAEENSRESARLIEQVAAESTEQARSITEINQGIEQISMVVQANSATAQESAAAAQEMSAQAVVMNEIVARFKLRQTGRETANSAAGSGNHSREAQPGMSGFALAQGKY